MGKPTGFMEYNRMDESAIKPKERIKNFKEFHELLSMEERKKQGARCMECGIAFCQYGKMLAGMVSGCPLHNLIPEWNDHLYHGTIKQALSRLKKTNNFPEFTARVCPAPCEAACTNNLYGKPVTIKANEFAIAEYGYENSWIKAKPPKVRTGKKIAIIGSGPAGLAAADQLNKRGHFVTVFERSDRIGGLLMYGIPNMKLEKWVIERRIKIMQEEGVTFLTNSDVGKQIKAASILKEYDSVILTCGASNPRDILVSNRDAKGIYFAVDFLAGVTKSLLDSNLADQKFVSVKEKRVIVIGGGDTGNDCIGTSIRLGCKSVLQVEMLPKLPEMRSPDNPWPEWPKVLKTDYGQEEAISVFGNDPRVYQTTVKEFIKDKEGNLCKVKLVKLESKKDETSSRMIMKEIEGSEYLVDADIVLIAAGFTGTQKYIADAFGVELNERGNVKTKENEYTTTIPNVFTAGDMHRGQSLVVWAIHEGREAAKAADKALMGYTNLE